MKKNLDFCIEQWKNAKKNTEMRSVNAEPSKIANGEYEITLKMSATVTEMSQSEKVALSRKVKTAKQSSASDNSEADIQIFEECAKLLERDFEKKCGTTYARLANLQNPGGYIERNPYS